MGNKPPSNRTGKDIVRQKTDTASKTGVLSLREHNLANLPEKVFELTNLRTLDISNNKLRRLPDKLSSLINIKSLNCENNKLIKGSLGPIQHLSNLTTLNLSKNKLGSDTIHEGAGSKTRTRPVQGPDLPPLPPKLKQIKLCSNQLDTIPPPIYAPTMTKLERVDLSNNSLAAIPVEFFTNLCNSLVELNLNRNSITALILPPPSSCKLTKLKSLSLQYNHITAPSRKQQAQEQEQPLPEALFADTPLIDLDLNGNDMTNTQLNEFDGFDVFLERRRMLKSKNISGGALTDLSVCGLE